MKGRSGRQAATCITVVVSLAAVARAQAPRGDVPRFPTGTELIEVEVIVTDGKGVPVLDLTQEDFVLLEEGRPQTITHFTLRQTPRAAQRAGATPAAPSPPAAGSSSKGPILEVNARHIVIAVDDLHLAGENLLRAKETLSRFVEEQLEPDDEVALITTSGNLGFLQQMTGDRAVLKRAVERLSVSDRRMPDTLDRPYLTTYQADLIIRGDRGALDQAVRELIREDPMLTPQLATAQVEAKARHVVAEAAQSGRASLATLENLVRRLEELRGRKILVLLSDGFYVGRADNYDLRSITGGAIRSGVVIYSLDARGLDARSPVGDASQFGQSGTALAGMEQERYRRLGYEADREGLHALARDTGGLTVFNTSDIGKGLQRVLDDTETHYVLAYEPPSGARNGQFRKIEVRVPGRKGLTLRTRRGYLAGGAAAAAKPPAKASGKETAAAGGRSPRLQEGLVSVFPRRDVPLVLAAGILDAPGDGPVAMLSAEVDVSRLSFERAGDLRRATLELAGLIFDEKGQAAGSFNDRRELSLDPTAYDRALRDGFSFTTRSKLAPGLYQVRAAVLEGGERLGTASRWIEVPDLGRKAFAASDLFLSTAGRPAPHPAMDGRRFGKDEAFEFVLWAYNAKADAEVLTDVLFETQVLAGTKAVVSENPQNTVVAVGETPQERVAFSRRLALATLGPGEYTLRVLVTDRIAKTSLERRFRFAVE